jgi:hypothetical protein
MKVDDATLEEALLSQAYFVQALINVLERKGVLTRKEVIQKFEGIKEVMNEGVVEVASLN